MDDLQVRFSYHHLIKLKRYSTSQCVIFYTAKQWP